MINRNLSEKKKEKMKRERGITLIALVVTIVVLIILASISILAVFGDNGIISRAQIAKSTHEEGKANEANTLEDYASYVGNYMPGEKEDTTGGVTVTVDGTEGIKLTKANVANYLGKVVTNYVPTTSSVTIDRTPYRVSTNYRLYYVDFDGKYGETNGVYLKADCTSFNHALSETDTTADTANNVKIRALNPSLYASGVTAPIASNENMKAVTWLLNTSNWDSLKTGASLANKVNYVVGAPSVEMMFDSYNTKYGLTDETMNTGTLTADTKRARLFYQYPTTVNINGANLGYAVGPSNSSSASNGYYTYTSEYSVKTDSTIDSMYYPGRYQSYWLASPSARDTSYVLCVQDNGGGFVNSYAYKYGYGFCPLVSLQSSAILELQ